METALHFESASLQTFKKLKETPEIRKELRASVLVKELSESEGWEVVKKMIDSQIDHLEKMQGMVEPSDSVESVGFRFLAAQTAITYLKQVRDYPESVLKASRARTSK